MLYCFSFLSVSYLVGAFARKCFEQPPVKSGDLLGLSECDLVRL